MSDAAPETARLLEQLRPSGQEPPWYIGQAWGVPVYLDPAMAPGDFRVVNRGADEEERRD